MYDWQLDLIQTSEILVELHPAQVSVEHLQMLLHANPDQWITVNATSLLLLCKSR